LLRIFKRNARQKEKRAVANLSLCGVKSKKRPRYKEGGMEEKSGE
jgi:hypothetical protein